MDFCILSFQQRSKATMWKLANWEPQQLVKKLPHRRSDLITNSYLKTTFLSFFFFIPLQIHGVVVVNRGPVNTTWGIVASICWEKVVLRLADVLRGISHWCHLIIVPVGPVLLLTGSHLILNSLRWRAKRHTQKCSGSLNPQQIQTLQRQWRIIRHYNKPSHQRRLEKHPCFDAPAQKTLQLCFFFLPLYCSAMSVYSGSESGVKVLIE